MHEQGRGGRRVKGVGGGLWIWGLGIGEFMVIWSSWYDNCFSERES